MTEVTISISVTVINEDVLNYLLKDRDSDWVSCIHVCTHSPNYVLFARHISKIKWLTKIKYRRMYKNIPHQSKQKWN